VGWQPGGDPERDGAAGLGSEPSADGRPPRDPRLDGLGGFIRNGAWDVCPPSAALAEVLEGASGAEWRCPRATRGEMIGLLRRWAAIEAWAAAGRLGLLRALIRDDDQPLPGGGYHGDLPDGWTKSLTHEVAPALAVSVPTAEAMMWLAWDLQARLRGIGDLLADGTLAYSKARAVADAFQLLSDEHAAQAEALILSELPGKNFGQVKMLAEQAAVTVDPSLATRRREHAEREKSRVQLFREESGAAALSGRDLPTDQALAAHAQVCARAQAYQESRAFPGVRMDQLRAAAYLDLLNSVTAEDRIAAGILPGFGMGAHVPAPSDTGDSGPNSDAEPAGDAEPGGGRPEGPGGDGPGGDGPGGDGPGGDGPGGEGQGGPPSDDGPDGKPRDNDQPRVPAPVPASPPPSNGTPIRRADLIVPLATLLGLAERPGEGHGLGPLDPSLCQALALAAAGSPNSKLCVTVTDPNGYAIAHGCAKSPRKAGTETARQVKVGPVLPARLNLTIPAASLHELSGSPGPPGQRPWSFTRNRGPDPAAPTPRSHQKPNQ
jgi:hypothetical protein